MSDPTAKPVAQPLLAATIIPAAAHIGVSMPLPPCLVQELFHEPRSAPRRLAMRKREEVKLGHERAVADQLLEVEKINAAFGRAGDANKKEPDVIYQIGGQVVGIEVATAYSDEAHAQDEWQIAAHERPLAPGEIRPGSAGIIGNPDQVIRETVQEKLEDKCSKTYLGIEETWLCINMLAALSDAASVAECLKNLKVPEKHRFARIYLTYTAPQHEGGKYVAKRIL